MIGEVIADVVYLLCTLTSLACGVLLLRAFSRNGVRLLFWSGICFLGLAANSLMVLIDLDQLVFSNFTGLEIWRLIPALLGLAALCYGLIAESA